MSTLLSAARHESIPAKGEIRTADDHAWTYHVHGNGYSFKDRTDKKEIHFDVIQVDGMDHVDISIWKLFKFAESIGESLSMDEISTGLRTLSGPGQCLVKLERGPFETYYWRDSK